MNDPGIRRAAETALTVVSIISAIGGATRAPITGLLRQQFCNDLQQRIVSVEPARQAELHAFVSTVDRGNPGICQVLDASEERQRQTEQAHGLTHDERQLEKYLELLRKAKSKRDVDRSPIEPAIKHCLKKRVSR